jgi:hypothetical protein
MDKVEKGFKQVINNQAQSENQNELRSICAEENAIARDGNAQDCANQREGRWKKRYWGAALAALIMVVGATWWATNYVTHYYGTVLFNDKKSTSELMDANKELLGAVQVHQVLIADLSNQVKEKTLKQIWFDRKREHSNEGFQSVDEKYPAGYEIWDGETLIERWHWRIAGQPKTDQFGEYILRCVATYDDKGEYSGFTQSVMSHYPTDRSGDLGFYKNNKRKDSIEFTFNTSENKFELRSNDMGILWEKGELKHSYLMNSDFKHSWEITRNLSDIVKTLDHYKYLVHISSMFTFVDKEIVKPFDQINPEFADILKQENEMDLILNKTKLAMGDENKLLKKQHRDQQNKLEILYAVFHDDPKYLERLVFEDIPLNWEMESMAHWMYQKGHTNILQKLEERLYRDSGAAAAGSN